MYYLETDYGYKDFWLILIDKNKNEFFTFSFVSNTISENTVSYFKQWISPMNESAGHIYEVYSKQEYCFIKKEENVNNLYSMEMEILDKTNWKYFLHLPLLIYGEVIGILSINKPIQSNTINQDELLSLQKFSDQTAGAVFNAGLLKQTERQKQEIENLNQLIKSLNEELDLHVIMIKVQKYVGDIFGIEHYSLYLVSDDKQKVEFLDASFPSFATEEDKNYIRKLDIPINGIKGAHAFAFKAKRPFYLSKVRKTGITPEELFIIEKGNFQSFLLIPLILQNEPIGILNFFNEGKMDLTKENITKLSILGEQLAGIINGSNLFNQVQSEKEKSQLAREEAVIERSIALLAQQEAEMAKKEVSELNLFLKNIQERFSISEVMDETSSYIKKYYNIDYYFLWIHNPKDNTFHFHSGEYPNEDQRTIFLKNGNKILHLDQKGAHAFAAKRKNYTFLPNLKNRTTIPEEDENQEILEMASLLMIPLYVQDTLVGMLDFSHGTKKMRLEKQSLERIYIFCQQIAGIIQNFHLLDEVRIERDKSEKLLLNILPKDVAQELKEKGFAEPVQFESVSVMFTDFKGFTQIAEKLTPTELLKDLDSCFVQFDKITERYNLEKLKTIGDSYMCAGGIPRINRTHAIDCVLASLEIQSFMNMMREMKEMLGLPCWELRLGIHSGSLVAGVIGEKKFAYDVWGDTVNIASRMESSGAPGKINISGVTYNLVKEFFDCEYRGMIMAKNKGEVAMYYVNGLKPEYSINSDRKTPNGKFWKTYNS
jgi:class 3 adenylate cyclase